MAKTELPKTREALLELHAETRRAPQCRRPQVSTSTAAAIDLLGRIEVEIARLERAMDPPLV